MYLYAYAKRVSCAACLSPPKSFCSIHMAYSTLYPAPTLLNRQVAGSCPSGPPVHRGEIVAALVGGFIALTLLTVAAIFYLVQSHQLYTPPHTKQLLFQNEQNSSPGKQALPSVASTANQFLHWLANVPKYRISTLPYWTRKSLPLLPTYTLESPRSLSDQTSAVQTPDWLTRPLLLPQPVDPQCEVVIAGNRSSLKTLPEAIGLGLDIPACYSPSIYSARASRVSSSTLFEEDMASVGLLHVWGPKH
jgi:hypothetical protein